MQEDISFLLDVIGTFAFAISGIKLATDKQMDWFGAYIIGLVTAIGGGTTRDLLLGLTPFWMLDMMYFLTTGVAFITVLVLKSKLLNFGRTLLLFDAIGLGLFTVVGITKSMDVGLPFWVCIVMGTITGVVGGVMRDVLANEVPLIFRKDIYAIACVAGGMVFYAFYFFNVPLIITEIATALTVVLLRLTAVKYHIALPRLKSLESKN